MAGEFTLVELSKVEHDKLRKSVRYQRLKVDNPEAFSKIELVFTEHVKGHQELAAQARKAQIEEQIRIEKAMKGGKNA